MNNKDVPYRRKSLYLLLTIPMIGMYIAVSAILLQFGVIFLGIYLFLFVLVAFGQSYVCVYLQCPYVGKFAPCVGGFCLPSSQIARWFKNVKRSERLYNIIVTLASVSLLGIIILPVYFLYQQSVFTLIGYLGIVLVYSACFLWFICPVCGTRHVCPGGRVSTKIRNRVKTG
ncbi:hypothetical protein AMJ86_10100 [bacterium SM23_57]|jgi:hypothetical protein|nr:MAG: hypothetical protein AMJ86_10100 [bacterium SM23_57]